MKVLGIDPGYARLGWGVTERKAGISNCLDYGVMETHKGMLHSERLLAVKNAVSDLINKFKPAVVGVEELLFQKNVKTALKVSEARGVILLTAVELGVPVFEIGPKQIKMGLTSDGSADKLQVQQMVKQILKLKEIPQPDDAADALAIALVTEQLWNNPLI
jgi:crossover junction endodeoxyribonuclease RuvC